MPYFPSLLVFLEKNYLNVRIICKFLTLFGKQDNEITVHYSNIRPQLSSHTPVTVNDDTLL